MSDTYIIVRPAPDTSCEDQRCLVYRLVRRTGIAILMGQVDA